MIVIAPDHASQPLDRIRDALRRGGVRDVRTFRIAGRTVLLTEEGDAELAEQVRAGWRDALVLHPVSGSPLSGRTNFPDDTVVDVGFAAIGGNRFTVMAGPCAVEGRIDLETAAGAVRDAGATVLRGGAYKPRTSPHSFQGSGPAGIELLADVGRRAGLPVVSEVVDPRDVEHVAQHVDLLQIGTRNAQNYALLTEVGRSGVPVLLKRGFGCTVDEWLGAAEYVLREGNGNVILCERGIRTFESSTRFTLDLAAVAVVKRRSHLPVVVDPSHGTGSRELVPDLALAAAAAGADGLLVDVHLNPAHTQCDGDQALSRDEFHHLMARLDALLRALGRDLWAPVVLEAV